MTEHAEIDAQQAAHLLRDARNAEGAARTDAVEWALAAMPELPRLQRLRIRQLLDDGDTSAADALIARCEHAAAAADREHPALLRMKAESRLLQDRLEEAQDAVIRALAHRARHTGTLRLAAEIAIRAGRGDRAVRWLRQAVRLRPRCDDIKRELCQALLQTGRPGEATQTLDRMSAPPLALRSAARRAQGRVRDALDLIQRARRAAPSVANDDDVRGEEIRLLEESGFIDRLSETLDLVDADPLAGPTVRILAGRAWLRLGEYRRVICLASRLRRSGPAQREALGQVTIAAWMLGRTRLARRALLRLQRTPRGVDPVLMAALWRRALHGGVLRDQGDPRRAGADRQVSLLRPLVETAARTLARAPDRDPALREHGARCAALLGVADA